ncbi:HutD/Ves family protein [Prosthecomicrobium sp. N25]|uniref:HutD/Ves family protein n=1 Tax=Prosthecomicrobium sp. N25 TaxID=3129254 RepID=UPI0030778816
MMRLLRAADRTPQPWRNGGGVTADVFVSPAGAGLDAFAVRLSLARIEAAGPFSPFPGIDRTLTVVAGDLELAVGGAPAVLLTPASAPFRFSGDAPVAARPTGSPVLAFNVMTRRGEACHRVERIRLAPGQAMARDLRGALLLWVEGDGVVEVGDETLAPGPLDALACPDPCRLTLSAGGTLHLVLAEFDGAC